MARNYNIKASITKITRLLVTKLPASKGEMILIKILTIESASRLCLNLTKRNGFPWHPKLLTLLIAKRMSNWAEMLLTKLCIRVVDIMLAVI